MKSFAIILLTFFSFSFNTSFYSNLEYVKTDTQEILKTFKLYSGRLYIKLPSEFGLMSEEIKKVKYPTSDPKAITVCTNKESTINILLELSKKPLNQNRLPVILNQIQSEFSRIPEIQLENAEIQSVNEKDILVVEFISEAVDGRIYNLMFITNIDGYTFTSNFNCTIENMPKWKPIGKQILNSLKEV
ncbi:hypothetical protein ESY86_09535 [Subsaximicrobium wynnwilliamsii]|uniref:DUF1795 domain-containing protein n=1 Tax=Subsaximicrobium wynnwilliamsii TaxID=291179 RepID=A0A5C6ZGN0_9FLAO|nr:hypothetical protein [Subsaximicrobium wynnwilliamsii]TXD83452.1 hypothetical protein ESY87_09275 [Subsaximicrobium wynnwilliamsii]TXD89273.1 hypothetical protein ESY86_09535 [Subsaximicrobium wynnwilliamsii]TXE03132.1 hypothetical protein ESY88_08985 [Subsaximicrobium wynnwilliamsii]